MPHININAAWSVFGCWDIILEFYPCLHKFCSPYFFPWLANVTCTKCQWLDQAYIHFRCHVCSINSVSIYPPCLLFSHFFLIHFWYFLLLKHLHLWINYLNPNYFKRCYLHYLESLTIKDYFVYWNYNISLINRSLNYVSFLKFACQIQSLRVWTYK